MDLDVLVATMEATPADALPDLGVLMRRPAWMAASACADLDVEAFHPRRHDLAAIDAARSVCASCPVRFECLVWSLGGDMAKQGTNDVAIYGGLTDAERRALRDSGWTLTDPLPAVPVVEVVLAG